MSRYLPYTRSAGGQRVIVTGQYSTRDEPSGVAMDQRVRQEPPVVARRKIGALMRAPRFLARERGVDDRLGDLEHEGQLQRRDAARC